MARLKDNVCQKTMMSVEKRERSEEYKVMHLKKQIDQLRDAGKSYWTERLHSQLDYLYQIIQVDAMQDSQQLENVVAELMLRKQENGALLKQDVLEAEQALACYQSVAKSYLMHMVSHAHIDMDWRWGWEETVGVVIDTFRTMLKLLEEYPDFIYTQSQASVYEIIEKYAPEMLPQIRKYVQEGRWEVIATSWVEADKNMPNTESMARHILYTKKYLSELLTISVDNIEIDFEPDTFGHGGNVPEILQQGGVRYYYHCRGNDQEELYRWRAPSGAEVLALRDPQWYYLREMDYHIAWHVPGFCARNHVKSALRFYGVGDHGGGPSRRDIERILDMQTWPLMPTIVFSRLHDFFHAMEEGRELAPVVERELNFIFTGCYTAQSRLKQANRHGEDRLYDSEALCAMASAAGCDLSAMPSVEPAWRNILFNQFHDIITGSCVREAKERGLGRFQDACAIGLANSKRAMLEMGKLIATDAFSWEKDASSLAESGGHGYGSWKGASGSAAFSVNGPANASGRVRAYTLFNTTPYERQELVELTIWDWTEPLEATIVCAEDGKPMVFDVLETDKTYWHHKFSVVSFVATVPAFGYQNYYVKAADLPANREMYFEGPRMHRQTDAPIVLENELIRAVFRQDSMELISLLDKSTGQEQLKGSSAYFNLVDEQSVMPYSSWTVGRVGAKENLNRSCYVSLTKEGDRMLCGGFTYELAFRSSKLKVSVFLPEKSSMLRFSVEVDWHEVGRKGEKTPQLQFCVPYGYEAKSISYDVPGGVLERPEIGHDVPAILYAAPIPSESRSGIMLTSDCKYGYRAYEGQLCLDLLRASVNPDSYPEIGVHNMELGLGVVPEPDWYQMTKMAVCFAHPLYIYSNTIHAGILPGHGHMLQLEGSANVSAVKLAEDGQGLVFRLYQSGLQASQVRITMPEMVCAQMVDLLEREQDTLSVEEDTAIVELPPKSVRTIKLKMATNLPGGEAKDVTGVGQN
ncbi:MAG: hypothetical protein J6C37_06180 [Roseburia sp.]|nr:hypothetical protein [Roseburia sp.]